MKRTHVDSERWFDVVLENERAQAATMVLEPGESTGGRANAHRESDQWLYVVSGSGRATVGDLEFPLAADDLVVVEAGETHEFRAADDERLETLSIYVPPAY